MSRYYYFFKERDDTIAFNDGGYAGIPSMHDYCLEKYNPQCDNCENKYDKSDYACWGCFGVCQIRYKITKDKLSKIVKNMNCNQDLFKNLMNEISQDYIWMYEDF